MVIHLIYRAVVPTHFIPAPSLGMLEMGHIGSYISFQQLVKCFGFVSYQNHREYEKGAKSCTWFID